MVRVIPRAGLVVGVVGGHGSEHIDEKNGLSLSHLVLVKKMGPKFGLYV